MSVSEFTRTGPGWQADQAAWAEIEHLDSFTAPLLAERLGCPLARAQGYLKRWRAEGRVTCSGPGSDGRTLHYHVAPNPISDLTGCSTSQAMWTAMRLLRRFSPTDVLFSVSAARPDISLKEVQSYCQFLAKANVLRVLKKAGFGAREASYAVARNSGPLAPYQKRVRVLIDPNEGQIIWTPEVEE